MDLFHMRRYDAEAEVEETDDLEVPKANRDTTILESLKNKLKKKGNKKRKLSEVENEEQDEDADNMEVDEGEKEPEAKVKTKKKRGKKKKTAKDDEADTGFTVLGENMNKNKSKVRRVLPAWLSNPDIVSVDFDENQLPVANMPGIGKDLLGRLEEQGVTHFFPVQRQVIPRLLPQPIDAAFRPSDVCVSAPTGSGKTLAFVLPLVQALQTRVVPKVRGLVILPVQDLANQVYKVFQMYCGGTGLRVKLLTAQKSFAQEQSELVRRGVLGDRWHSLVDIVVATPGRLVDHLQKTEGFSLTELRYIVIDEADRVMEDVQNDWLTHVEAAVYGPDRPRPGPLNVASMSKGDLPLQKLLFSATLSQNPEQLQQLNLYEPKLFTSVVKPKDILHKAEDGEDEATATASAGKDFEFAGQYTTPAELSEKYVVCQSSLKKPLVLHHLLKTLGEGKKKALVFTKSLDHTHFLAVLMKEYGLEVGELSSQAKATRSRVLNKFASGSLDLLVCSDALARGIDIGVCDLVVSYDCPQFVKTYIHRVGRTARAGRQGIAITLLETEAREEKRMRSLMKEAGKDWTSLEKLVVDEDDEEAEGLHEAAMEKTRKVIEAEKEEVMNKRNIGKKMKLRNRK